MGVLKRVSLVDQVYEKIRNKIIEIKVPLGSKLNVSKIQEEYGVSSTPVREAMNRLYNEGLIEFENNVGAHVISFTETDVREIQELASAYEMAAVRFSMEKTSQLELAEKMSVEIDKLRRCKGTSSSCECKRALKELFYQGADNSRLMSKSTSINGMEQMLDTLFSMTDSRELEQDPGDYGLVFFDRMREGVKLGDFAAVCDALEDHRHWTGAFILKKLNEVK